MPPEAPLNHRPNARIIGASSLNTVFEEQKNV
jgi:hypothetical protein